jgi:hypothetical protein
MRSMVERVLARDAPTTALCAAPYPVPLRFTGEDET